MLDAYPWPETAIVCSEAQTMPSSTLQFKTMKTILFAQISWFYFFCQITPVLLLKAKISKQYLLIFIHHSSQWYFYHERCLFINYVSLQFQSRDPKNSNIYFIMYEIVWLCSLLLCKVFKVKIINFLQPTLQLSSGLFSKIRKVDYSSQ